jgi:dihydroorotase
MSTENPAKAVGVADRLGTLAVGKQADLSVLEIKDGNWMVYDILGVGKKSDKAVIPIMAIKKGEIYEAGWGPRPWGWEPDEA